MLQLKRNSQPRYSTSVDYSNPIVRGLVFLWHPSTPFSNLAPTNNVSTTRSGNVYYDRFGIYYQRNSLADTIVNFSTRNFLNNNVTVLGAFQWVSTVDEGTRVGVINVQGPAGDKNFRVGPSSFNATSPASSAFAWFQATGTTTISTSSSREVFNCIAGAYNGSTHTAYNNGIIINSGSMSVPTEAISSIQVGTAHGNRHYVAAAWNRALSAQELASVTANPWQLFAPVERQIWTGLSAQVQQVTVARPASDIIVAGWSASTGLDLYAMLDETVASDTDYIISPVLAASNDPVILGLSSALDAGTWAVKMRVKATTGTGDVRASLLDGSNIVVGTSEWLPVTGDFSEYTFSVNSSAQAIRVRIEVRE